MSREHDPIEVTRQILQRYALVGSNDSEGHYYAAYSAEIPEDGEYWLAIGSSLVRPSAGTYRLVVGVDAPDVLSDNPESSGPTFVFAEKDAGALERGVVLVTGELSSDQVVRFYYLADMAAAQTFYAYAEAIDSDLKPALILHDHSDKPVAYGNYTATDSQGWLQYKLPRKAENFRLQVSSQDPDGKLTAGNFRLLMGLNAPEVLQGEGEPTGRELLREPIPVRIGVKMQQITEVDQKAENFGVVATLVMHWRASNSQCRSATGSIGGKFSTPTGKRSALWSGETETGGMKSSRAGVGVAPRGGGGSTPVPAIREDECWPPRGRVLSERDRAVRSTRIWSLKLEAIDHERHQGLPAVEAHITGQGPQIVEEDLAREELAQGPIAGIE